jgi:AcrR family transcriptional regulator/DNA-binding MarR family transcriptional regulator
MVLPPPEDGRVPMRRGTPGPRGGGVFVSRVQQTRLLDAAVAVVAERGVARLSATRVSALAGMSTKTFYDLFADGEDCFLGVFDRAVDELAAVAAPVWAGEGEWVQRVRSVVIVLLASVERDAALGRVVFVEALGAGPRVLARRAEVFDRVAQLIDEGRVGGPAGLPSLVAAGVAGAAFSVIHARLVEERPESLMELVGPVMATVVLPYRGQEASARELALPLPEPPEVPVLPEPAESTEFPADGVGGEAASRGVSSLDGVRATERTLMVLASVAEHAGANNRGVAAGADIHDDAQISRLLSRLEEHGLVENRGARTAGLPKAWWLTASGAEFLRTGRMLAAGEPAPARARSVGRGKSKPSGAGVARRGAKRGASEGGVLLGGIDPVDYRRALLLRAAAAAVDEHGYSAATVAHITSRAKISRRTFYELFVDREECLLAVMHDLDTQLTAELRAADLGELAWRERVRSGLWTVLRFFDREPVLARFCVVESARGDDRMAAYREALLAWVTGVFAEGGLESVPGGGSSPLTAEGLTGAVVSIVSRRLAATGRRAAGASRKDTSPGGPLSDLLGELMALIVLPYLGAEAVQEERACPAPVDPGPASLPVPAAGSKQGGRYLGLDADSSSVPQPRVTYRTALVLEAIAQAPGISNLGVARHAQINDQGQVSKLLARLERSGLVLNTDRGQSQGAPNEWRLTTAGQKLEQAIHERQRQAA